MKKWFIYCSLFIISISIVGMVAIQPVEARYCDQFGCKTDYSYTCDFRNSLSIFKFDGNGFDRNGKKSRCYNDRRHYSSPQASDPRFIYDQFGYKKDGTDQYGRDSSGRCHYGRCVVYYY